MGWYSIQGYRLSERDKEQLMAVFGEWDNALLMELIWLIENLIRERRLCLTERNRYCNSYPYERRIREIMSTIRSDLENTSLMIEAEL